ncbi:unnamed protein product [Blepharisma stoltei]|uniref:TNFR-Cys domain-containing protein n=1 Tax=Blepharisma stoltei TaxID=1481888 RepID=A0AAU9KA63_9CILI|nr:unnamed protein product [Blepharisma stoltei]
MTFYINNAPGTPVASTNLLFRDEIGKSLMLGKSSLSSFRGFIYNFKLWNTPITDFTSYYSNEICGNLGYGNCLWSCDIDSYYTTSCTSCTWICNQGCRRPLTCNICDDALCDICGDFETGTCTQCISHASGTPCSCNTGYSWSNDGLSCNTCYSGCSSYYYIGGLCEQDCPTGYTANGSPSYSCDLIDSTTDMVLYMNLIDKVCLSTVSGFNVGSSSTNVYPDWDSNDPIPSKSRGYYFAGTSYMEQIFKFSPWFTLSLWVKGTSDGYLMTKCYLGTSYLYVVFSSGIPTLTITLQDANTLSVTCGTTSIFNSWSFLSFTGELLNSGQSKVQCYLGNSFILSSLSATSSYLRDNALGNLIIGTKEDYTLGFTGYIWNLKIFITSSNQGDDYSTSGCSSGCTICPSDKNCLSDCLFSTYPTACTGCKTSCNKGCVSNLACSLCKNKECNHCDTFTGACIDCITNAGFVGTNCQCNTNALWNSVTETCDLCYNLCGSCSAYTFSGCTSCISSHYLYENMCIQYCPIGYTSSSGQCNLSSSLNGFVFNLMPHQIMDTVTDLQSSLSIQTGQSSNFYPNYDTTDPYAAEYRGYYFLGTSYMKFVSSSLLFAPKFTISTWINPILGTSIILSKQDSSVVIYLELGIFSDNKPILTLKLLDGSVVSYKSSSAIVASQWNLIIVSSDISSTPAQIISFNVNSVTDTSIDLASSWFEDLQASSTTLIGAHYTAASTFGNYFTGFLWDLKVYNLVKAPSALYLTSCSGCSQCPTDNSGSCLANCPISKYWDGAACADCSTGCTSTGCVRVDINCNLCDDVICYECHDYTGNCVSCRPHAHLDSGKCVCDTGYSWDTVTESCILCYSSCKSCTGVNFYECTTCISGNYLVNGLCLSYCPSGYKASTNVCAETNAMMFDLELETLNGVIYDKASQVPILTGSTSNFYMNYDSDDPIPAPLRGMWFNGDSSILHMPKYSNYSSPLLIIGPVFTYSIWINPWSDTSTVMYTQDSSNSEEFAIKLNAGYPSIELSLKIAGFIAHQCKTPITQPEWNHVVFTLNIDALGHSYIQCTVNTIPNDSSVDLGLSYYLTSKTNPSGTIGGEIQGTNYVHYYKGFIYKIVIYHTIKTIENLALAKSYCTEPCPSCLPSKKCIPNCSIDKYWFGPAYNVCSDCKSNCKYGCKDSSIVCNLCYSTLCSNCTDYDSYSCTSCVSNAENIANCTCENSYGISKNLTYCAPCNTNAYTEDGYCKTCPNLCETCTNSTNCLTCIENSYLSSGLCKCNVGFNGTTNCTEIWFYANLTVNEDNSLNLTFSNDLAVSLDSMDVLISIANVSDTNLTWTMEERNSSFYLISLDILTKVSTGTQVTLKFLNKNLVVSVSNELLKNHTLISYLYYYNPYSEDPTIHAIASQTTAVVQSITGVALALSFINPNPSSLWSMPSCEVWIWHWFSSVQCRKPYMHC